MEMQHAFFVMLPMVITIMILGHDPLSIVLYIVVHGTHNQKEEPAAEPAEEIILCRATRMVIAALLQQ